jgi:hypothetical protein
LSLPSRVHWHSHTAGCPPGITWPHRDGSLDGITTRRSDNKLSPPRRCQTALRGRPIFTCVTTDCRLTGGAPETSPFRTTGYSKRWLDPRRVTDRTGRARGGNRDPRRAFDPGLSAPAQLVSGSVGGPHRCPHASDPALSPGAGAGANPVCNGVRASAATRPHGVGPQRISPVQSRSPSLPQFGSQLPAPVRCSTGHRTVSFPSPKGLWFCPLHASQ